MKNILLIALSFCLSVGAAHAQVKSKTARTATSVNSGQKSQENAAQNVTLAATGHVVNIFSENGEKFFLILDGEKINSEPKAKVTARNLDKGYYRYKVIFDDERLPDFNGNLQTESVDPGWYESTYRIKKKVKKGKVSYSLGYGDWKKIGEAAPTRNQETVQDDKTVYENIDIIPVPAPANPGKQDVITPQPVTPVVNPCGAALPEASFQGMLTAIGNAGFEDTKVQTASVILDGNCLTAMQIKQVIQKFGFEQSRLNFAKTAYNRCLDRQNYLTTVNEAFQFNTSKDAMNAYILEQKK